MLLLELATAAKGGGSSITINVAWLIAGGFAAALGAAIWKALPWIIKQALDEKIDSKLLPMVTEVHKRIDEHMNTEESSFDTLADTVGDLRTQLSDRDELFNGLQETMDKTRDVLADHIESDEQQFKLSAEALVDGQRRIDQKLAEILANTNPGAVPTP